MFRGGKFSSRQVLVFLCFCATFTTYVERVGFSIAYTRMARAVGIDESTKGRVLSAFYWGYAVSQARSTTSRESTKSVVFRLDSRG